MTEEIQNTTQLFNKHLKYNPEDLPAAKMAGTEISTLLSSPFQVMTETIHKTMDKIVNDFRKKNVEKQTTTDAQVLTSKTMSYLTTNLVKLVDSKKSLHNITPEDIITAMNLPLDKLNLNESDKKQLIGFLLKIFGQPQERGSDDTE